MNSAASESDGLHPWAARLRLPGPFAIPQIAGWLVSLAIFLGLYIHYLGLAKPLVPYMDSVRYIGQVHEVLTGEVSLGTLWRQSASVGLMYQLVMLVEWVLWGLDSRITVMATAIAWATLFCVYLKALSTFSEQTGKSDKNRKLSIAYFSAQLVVGLCFFSPAGWEIWLLDLGLAQTLKNILFASYLYQIAKLDFDKNSCARTTVWGLTGVVIILFCSYGWSYSFSAAILFVVGLHSWSAGKMLPKGLLIAIPTVAAQAVYMQVAPPALNAMAVTADLNGLVNFILALLYGAASIFMGGEVADFVKVPHSLRLIIGASYLLVVCEIIRRVLIWRPRHAGTIFFLSIVMLGMCTLASIAIARGGQGYQSATASRYFMDYQFILIGFLGVLASLLNGPITSQKTAGLKPGVPTNEKALRLLVTIVLGLLLLGQGLTYLIEYKKAPYRAAIHQAQARVYLTGDTSEYAVKVLQTDAMSLAKAVMVSSQYNLASLRGLARQCNIIDAQSVGSVSDVDQAGRWLGGRGTLIFGDCPSTFHIDGYLSEGKPARTLILDVDGQQQRSSLQPGEMFSIVVRRANDSRIMRMHFSAILAPGEPLPPTDWREHGVFISKVGI
jgi:hypothetical protein